MFVCSKRRLEGISVKRSTGLSFFHKVWQKFPQQQRRCFFAWATAGITPGVRSSYPRHASGVIVAGEFSRGSGMGEGARLMVAALRKLGILCATWDIDTCRLDGEAVGPGAPLIMHVNAPMLPAALLRMPRTLKIERKVIGYWAWELPVVPDTWRHARRHVHEIWAPSRFTADALIPLGRPVRVVEHPVGLADQTPSARDRTSFGLPEKAVIVLVSFNLASSMVRKNPIDTILAFREAFGDSEDHLLVLKIGHTENYPEDMAAIRDTVGNATNIRIDMHHYSGADRLALMGCCDIVLSLHRSEGFGLVVAEAMALGRCVIATNWSATAEFMDSTCGLPVAYSLVPAHDPRGVLEMPQTCWALPDRHAAVQVLRLAADNPDLRTRLGKAGQDRIAEHLHGASLLNAINAAGVEAWR
ncbi:glycosyltransferase family 4 protein [Gluconobacter thailandicus]|uniref:Glycosyltransferase family 4 protein n=1 Tax=Gluconobacter thailandicus TaxID=257438 RepID=A0AAP9ETV6_GLUTH|nr:glycosyltransferase family 4 protein [Gluconobacter thailandicus]